MDGLMITEFKTKPHRTRVKTDAVLAVTLRAYWSPRPEGGTETLKLHASADEHRVSPATVTITVPPNTSAIRHDFTIQISGEPGIAQVFATGGRDADSFLIRVE